MALTKIVQWFVEITVDLHALYDVVIALFLHQQHHDRQRPLRQSIHLSVQVAVLRNASLLVQSAAAKLGL